MWPEDVHPGLKKLFEGLATADIVTLMRAFQTQPFHKNEHLARQGEPDAKEHVILSGKAVSLIGDAEGREICVALHVGPCVVTPNLARTADGDSLVSLRTETSGHAASFAAAELLELMRGSPGIESWANSVLRGELARKTNREWSLAALSAKERLDWFRRLYPRHETLFTHVLIASFLGMTPVTLSRLRNAE